MAVRAWGGVLAGAAAVAVARRLLARGEDLRDQVALITGGSRGLGLAIARELADRGCRLVICARDDAELAVAQHDLARAGADVYAVRCDVAEREEVEQLVKSAVDRYGHLDVLVNNAGVIQVGPLETMRVEDFEQAQKVMFWGTVYPTLAALAHMRDRRRGRIINITSIGGKISAPHLLPYNCAKFAAVGFSEGLRAELAGSGITVTTVVPGLMRTGSHLRGFFTGQQVREFGWFAMAANTPVLSMNADRAARRIVDAGATGRAEVILTPAAKVAVRAHGLFPGLTTRALGVANRLLPKAPTTEGPPTSGLMASEELDSATLRWAIGRGRSDAERFNQIVGKYESVGDAAQR